MGDVNPNRLRWGAIAWLLTLQFFVMETLAQARYAGSYSRADDVISALGAAESAAHQLMNASFVVQAALILGGALLLRPVLLRGAAQVAPVLLGAAALGVLLVGVFPTDSSPTAHAVGAVLYLVGGGLGLIALAYAVRPRSEAVATTLALLGLIATSATVFFLTGVTAYLGEGGTERAAAYPLPLGLALAGAALWRLGRIPVDTERPSRREERERARAEREARARVRDEALAAGTGSTRPAAHGSDEIDAGAPRSGPARPRD
ncbi:DUF998 domain-containing protein [Blastococcus mobilis]|uniref:Hypothetical membrane protein n=1 Tax=Blastococcus mobilis TaxID=1938746 RepID=A0A238Z6T9_9ACTN|nr:DUF998 domain-containing protein [Blastococcus mobilis]SNR78611.1 hypothetical membrane protein [Blastococcus mobilis]